MKNTQTDYCRLCAIEKPKNKLFNFNNNDEKWRDIITKLNRVNADFDSNPNIVFKTVCLICINSLDHAYEFVTAVEHAQVILNDIILVQVKKEHSLSDNESECSYEDPDVKYEDDEIKIKNESEESSLNFSPLPFGSKNSHVKKKHIVKSLDAIPLAQLKLTWSDYNWVCSVCGTQFPTIDELKTHSMQYHNCCNAYRCTDCNIRKLRLDSFLIHVRRHKKHLKLSCYKCFKNFSTPHETNLHKKTHNTSNFICNGCNTNFLDIDEMSKHTTTFYKDKRVRDIPLQKNNTGLTCMICKKSFKTKTSLNTHLLTHTERTRDHICEVCGKSFLHKQNLACHTILHNDSRPFKCEICKLSFKTKPLLRNHIGVHDGGKPFSCEQCGRCFRLKKQLASHSIIHTDSLPHVCSFCNKRFRFKTILNQHIRQHTGVKPYSCNLCQRDFTNWPNYNKHMKRRHGLDMARKKHTPDGLYPIDPKTGEVIYPQKKKIEEWKRNMMQPKRPGRPRVKCENFKLDIEEKECREKNNN